MNDIQKDDFMNRQWRPMMGWMYMVVCIFDFIIFPIGFTIVQFYEVEAVNDAFRQWQPITLLGGGLFHLAMGAVLGVAAWSRGQEKMTGNLHSSSYNEVAMYERRERESSYESQTPIQNEPQKKSNRPVVRKPNLE